MDQVKTGQTIAYLRKKSGFTQVELAEKLEVSDKAVSKWERGISCPDVSIWNKLSILLDTDIESLIYGHEGRSDWKGIIFLDNSIPASTTVFNKPLIHYLLSQFLLAGINDIGIIGKAGSLSLPGIQITMADNLNELNHWFTKSIFLIYGNKFLYGPNLTKHFKRAMSRTDGITILSTMKRKGQYPICVDADRRATVGTGVKVDQYFAEPFVFVPAGRYKPHSLFEEIFKEKDLNAETMVRGMISFDIHTYDDALRMAEFVKLMEETTGERIGCIEEILARRGLADCKEIEEICDEEIREYLGELLR